MSDAAALRAAAARVIVAVSGEGRTLDAAIAAEKLQGAARATVQSLAYGTIRWHFELIEIIAVLADRPASRLDAEVRALVELGLFQLLHGQTPPHAAVAETVEAARHGRATRAAGFVNALLRRFQREREAILARAHTRASARHAHPGWLIDAIRADWGALADGVLAANNEHPPLWLRVNRRRSTAAEYLARLQAAGIEATTCAFAPDALRLAVPVDVTTLPGFADGDVSVQDAAAQLAVEFVAPLPGERILDACAAPGGKTCHLLEREPALAEVVALDSDAERLRRVHDNLGRLGLSATVVAADAANPAAWWDGRLFDRILLDVPCSATGVIRRHPDIKLLRRPGDIAGLAAQQGRLLRAVWPLLKPGGRLVYVSCSVLKAENINVIKGFLSETSTAADATESARLSVVSLPPHPGSGPGHVVLPGTADTDGFFHACLERR